MPAGHYDRRVLLEAAGGVAAGAGPGADGGKRASRAEQSPTATWTPHVAVASPATTGTLYATAAAAATDAAMTLRPADLGTTTNDWIGRSQFSGPFLNATVDEAGDADDAGDVGDADEAGDVGDVHESGGDTARLGGSGWAT